MDFKSTLNLPDAGFSIPMKAELAHREPTMQQMWAGIDIYGLTQKFRAEAEPYVLHDGPPYTNGPIHLGTALNKVLKDFVVKSQTLMGRRAPYVPGYDNHGLPIEQAVMKKFAEQKIHPDVIQLRRACREHATHFIGIQTAQFQRLGIFGTWDRPYNSLEYRYEAELVRVFKRLVKHGYVYRGLRPVLWSPTSQTALADTEIIYKDHVSKAIYVAFPLKEDVNGLFGGFSNVSTVIWTTTPWTIPANLAVAFHPRLDYDLVEAGGSQYLLLHQLVDKTMSAAGISGYRAVKTFKGTQLEGTLFQHPVIDRTSLAVLAEYVTTEDGTGVVHTAPGHGREDFMTGQKYKLPVLCPVDQRGILTEEADQFAGISYKDADTVVVAALRDAGRLLAGADYNHSYPHAERDEKPVIFRATEQWFIGIDTPYHLDHRITLREKMLEEIEGVAWYPASGHTRIKGMIAGRPDWCISRQRPWGVGIPVFYGAESGEPLLDEEAIESVAKLIEDKGSDAWFEVPASEILPPGFKHPKTGETEFRKEVDVFDVWFDSGSTAMCVMEGNVEPRWKEDWPSEMYLEGSDQHRGWFNVSLILGTAVRGSAPYREVATHGMVVDAHGQKMSKRLGNVIDPVKVCDTMGADVLRYWVASIDYSEDMPCSDDLLKVAGEGYRTIRNTLRFLLMNLYDYDASAPFESRDIDVWVESQTNHLVKRCLQSYRKYDFNKVLGEVHNFCNSTLSRFYLDAIKDRMYCDGALWPSRRGAQKACHHVLVRLTKLIAPILPHTAEEVYAMIPAIERLPTVHVEVLDETDEVSPIGPIDRMLLIRADVFAQFEVWKQESGVKNSQDVVATLALPEEDARLIGQVQDLPNLFKMADVAISVGPFGCQFQKSVHAECERSRVRRRDVAEAVFNGERVMLSARDRRALGL